MEKGLETFTEVEDCIKVVGKELSSGWSEMAVTMAIMAVCTNWMAARCLSGSTVDAEVARLGEYLKSSVGRTVSEVGQAMSKGH